jgi:hypothetical protein
MAMNFPNNPTINDMFMVGNDMWSWNGVSWEVLPPAIGGILNLSGLTSSGAVTITNNTAANSLGTGALQVSGGASIAGNLYVGGNLVLAGQDLTIDSVTFKNGLTLSGNTSAATEFFTITNGAITPITTFQVDSSSGNTAIAGTLGVTGAITGNLTGTVNTAAQPNITSVGTLSNLTVSGKATIGGVNIKGFAVAMGAALA